MEMKTYAQFSRQLQEMQESGEIVICEREYTDPIRKTMQKGGRLLKPLFNNPVSRMLNRAVNPVASGGVFVNDFVDRRKEGQSLTKSTTGAAAQGLGWRAGAIKGAGMGATLMAPVPVPGARLAGVAVGGVTGGLLGSTAAGAVHDKVYDTLNKPEVKTAVKTRKQYLPAMKPTSSLMRGYR